MPRFGFKYSLVAAALLLLPSAAFSAERLPPIVNRSNSDVSDLAPVVKSAAPIVDAAPIVAGRYAGTTGDVWGAGESIEPSGIGTVTLASALLPPPCDSCVVDDSFAEVMRTNPPVSCTGWLIGIDYLTWKPRQRGTDFAVAENGGALTVGTGRIHNLELDRDNGVRGTIGYQTKTGWTLAVRGTYYDTDGTATVLRPQGLGVAPGIGELFATRSHPDTNEEANSAIAVGDLDYRVFDIEAGHSVFTSDFAKLRVFGGVRHADITQRMRIDYDGRDFVGGVVATDMTMESFGFQVGSEGIWKMSRGFGLFARTSTGLALGRFETTQFESNLNGVQIVTDTRDSYDQAVPTLELSGGVSWQFRGWELAAGYEMVNWFDLSNRAAYVDDIHEGLYGPFQNDLMLEGLFARISFAH